MKKSKFLLFLLLLALTFSLFPLSALAVDEPDTQSRSVILMDAKTEDIIYEKNADEQRAPASTTKIMTVLLAVEAIENGEFELEDSVYAYDDCQYGMEEDSSNADPAIEPGEILTVRDLLYCAMLASANEACNILGEYMAGSISDFVAEMNQRAEELGCTDTHFANTNGLEDSDHYTTARDMAIIASAASQHSMFSELCSTPEYTVAATNINSERYLKNTNAMLNSNSDYYYEYCFGIKTGYFSNAGYCLVSGATQSDIDLICVVLGGSLVEDEEGNETYTQYRDSIDLYTWCYENYSYQMVLNSTDSLIKVPVTMGTDETVAARPETSAQVLLPNDFDMDTLQFEYVIYSERDNDPLTAPVSAGQILGEVTVYADGKVCGTSNLVATNSVDLSKSLYLKAAAKTILAQELVHKILVGLVVVFALYLVLVFVYLVLRVRHKRSLRLAQKDYAERVAALENFPDAYTLRRLEAGEEPESLPEEAEEYEAEEEYEAPENRSIGSRWKGLVGRLRDTLRPMEDDEAYDEESYENETGDEVPYEDEVYDEESYNEEPEAESYEEAEDRD